MEGERSILASYVFYILYFVFIYLPDDYNNYKKNTKRNVERNGEEA